MSQPPKIIEVRSYDARTGSATFDVPPGSPLAAALADGTLMHVRLVAEPAEASTAGPEGHDAIARAVGGSFRTQLSDARAERDAAVRDYLAICQVLADTRAARDRYIGDCDNYVMRLRSVRNTLATVTASNDRLAAEVAMLEAKLAATESQREAASAQVAAFGELLAVAWPIVRDMFMQVYLRFEPIMRSAMAPAKVPEANACCGECGTMSGRPHASDCDA